MALLELSVRKSFASTGAAPGFDLDVSIGCEAGVTVLFGASGSGKTLTLDSIAGFLRPDQGRILLHNEILFDAQSQVFLPPRRRGVGYVFQNYALFPHMTVEQNLAFGVMRLPSLERHGRVREMLDLFGLGSLATRRPHELSGGEQQRASIARALIPKPRLLLLDEPARGLDHQLRVDFYAVLKNIRDNYHIPILLVTHDVMEGFVLADRMAVYRAGRIIQTGAPEEVYSSPRNPAVARLLGISNIFTGTVQQLDPMADCSLIRTSLFSVQVPYLPSRLRGDTVTFCIPRERIQLVQPGGEGHKHTGENRRENQIPVRVVEEIRTPGSVRLSLEFREASPQGETGVGPRRLEIEISRAAHAKMDIGTKKDWLAFLPKSIIHVFSEQGE